MRVRGPVFGSGVDGNWNEGGWWWCACEREEGWMVVAGEGRGGEAVGGSRAVA